MASPQNGAIDPAKSPPAPIDPLTGERYVPPSMPLSLPDAERYCERLARSHYENFTVVSWFLPKARRQHFYNVYAYCRWADDLADETGDAARALLVGRRTAVSPAGRASLCCPGRDGAPPVAADGAAARSAGRLPARPDGDAPPTRAAGLPMLGSGGPAVAAVRLGDAERQRLSDCTCTALQLANFWQDVAVDAAKGRIYLPLEDLERYGCSEQQILSRRLTPAFARLMRFEVERARELFAEGAKLAPMLDRRLRLDVELFSRGGQEILRRIEAQGYDVLTRRPVLSRWRKAALIAGGLVAAIR